jgi:hypothetical protein
VRVAITIGVLIIIIGIIIIVIIIISSSSIIVSTPRRLRLDSGERERCRHVECTCPSGTG